MCQVSGRKLCHTDWEGVSVVLYVLDGDCYYFSHGWFKIRAIGQIHNTEPWTFSRFLPVTA